MSEYKVTSVEDIEVISGETSLRVTVEVTSGRLAGQRIIASRVRNRRGEDETAIFRDNGRGELDWLLFALEGCPAYYYVTPEQAIEQYLADR